MNNATTCPLCDGPAQVEEIGLTKRHFICQACNEFVLWRSVEAHLASRAGSTKQKFASEARANTNPDTIYVISGRLPGSLPHIDIEGRSLPRSEALTS